MKTICRMCHEPVTPDNRNEVTRRVERRAAVSGRVRGYDYIKEVQHLDCERTPEAKQKRLDTVRQALEMAGVDRSRWDEVLREVR